MRYLRALFVVLLALTNFSDCQSHSWPPHGGNCLTYDEALKISTRWLSIFSTGEVNTVKQLSTIVSKDIASYDDTFGAPTFGIDELWAAVSSDGKTTTSKCSQSNQYLKLSLISQTTNSQCQAGAPLPHTYL